MTPNLITTKNKILNTKFDDIYKYLWLIEFEAPTRMVTASLIAVQDIFAAEIDYWTGDGHLIRPWSAPTPSWCHWAIKRASFDIQNSIISHVINACHTRVGCLCTGGSSHLLLNRQLIRKWLLLTGMWTKHITVNLHSSWYLQWITDY